MLGQVLKMGVFVFFLLTSSAAWTHAPAPRMHSFVVTGVLLNSGNARLIDLFVRFLSEEAGYPMQVVFASSYTELSNILRDHPDAVGWTCGAPFVEDHRAYGQQLVAVPLFQGKPFYHSLILTRTGRKEKRLADFKGKVLAYSDIRSNSGYVSPDYALHEENIDFSKYFRLMIDAGSHERSIEALLSGLADVAAVDEYVWVQYVRAHPGTAGKLHELERMGPYPFTPVVAGTGVDAATMKRLQDALTRMNADARGKVLLSDLGLDGFVQEPVNFYAPIARMLDVIRPSGRGANEKTR